MYNILHIVILVVVYYVLRCMYCIICYLIIKLTCSIEEPLCGNAIKSLLFIIIIYGKKTISCARTSQSDASSDMDLARAPRRTARKKGSGYENGLD
jgi:hypothetical protein